MADPWATLRAAAEDRRSGAAQIAEHAAGALAAVAAEEVPAAVDLLLRAHPSMAPLWRLATEVLRSLEPADGAARFLSDLASDATAAAVLAAHLPERLLTISYSSSVIDAVRLRRPERVACMLSEPGGEGQRLAEALSGWTDSIVVPDEEATSAIPAEAVVVGADAVTPLALVNKVKTAALARSAREHRVPCIAVAGGTKFVADELPVVGPFEAAPLDLFDAVAAPSGLLDQTAASARARRFGIHPRLRPLLEELRAAPG